MSFVSVLTKVGKILAEGAAIATGVQPLVAPLLGTKGQAALTTGNNDLQAITGVVTSIESIGVTTGLTGPQKLAAAIPLVGQIIQASELVSGHKIANEALFTKAMQEYTQATVDLLNSLDGGNVNATASSPIIQGQAVGTTVTVPATVTTTQAPPA